MRANQSPPLGERGPLSVSLTSGGHVETPANKGTGIFFLFLSQKKIMVPGGMHPPTFP